MSLLDGGIRMEGVMPVFIIVSPALGTPQGMA